MKSCAGTRVDGAPCRSTAVLEDGFCRLHSPTLAVDPVENGRRAGKRSGEVRRQRAKTLADLVVDRLERDADVAYKRIRAALDAGNLAAALQAVREAAGVTEEKATRVELEQAMRDRRARSLVTGSRWRQHDDYDDE